VLAVAQSAPGYCEVGPRHGAGAGGDHLGLVRGDVSSVLADDLVLAELLVALAWVSGSRWRAGRVGSGK